MLSLPNLCRYRGEKVPKIVKFKEVKNEAVVDRAGVAGAGGRNWRVADQRV